MKEFKSTRANWEEAAWKLHQRGDDALLDEPTPTDFDEKDWRWR